MTEAMHRRFEEAEPLQLLGLEIRILLPAEAMASELSVFEERDEPRAGPPLHVHRDAEEVFHVLEGEYQFHCDGRVFPAAPGDMVVIPRGAAHCFINSGAGPGRLLVTMRPGGFEGFFREVAARGLQVPGDMDAIVEIAGRYSLELLGPNPLAG